MKRISDIFNNRTNSQQFNDHDEEL